ncbi:hypothetical protein SEA_LUZDEMUNDO_32 [Microbacterium phage LuzDeMundo]|nr:hypothetical protein SEA_LUZDEMUNDO_32 [Microbacterium phage LuzDeMundo]
MYFKRAPYPHPLYGGNKVVAPLWHVVRVKDGREFTARCGYSYHFLLDSPETRVVRPVANVCKRCENKMTEQLPDDPPF